MKTKKTFFLALSLFALTFMNFGCSDDDNDNKEGGDLTGIIITVNGVSDPINRVKLCSDTNGENTLSETEFNNNQFKFDLEKANVDEKYLSPITSDDDFKNVTISDRSAKMCYGYFIALKDTEVMGSFIRNKDNKSIYCIYVDKDVTITGEYQKESNTRVKVNCEFLKGWNQYISYAGVDGQINIQALETNITDDIKWKYNEYKSGKTVKSITATVTSVGDAVNHVYLCNDNFGKNVISGAGFNNNQFAFDLEKVNVDAKYLSPITSDSNYGNENYDISDKSAKICRAQFTAFNDDKLMGYFMLTQDVELFAKSTEYVYADKNVTIIGEYKEGSITKKVFCRFLKGWNEVVKSTLEEGKINRLETGINYEARWEYVSAPLN